MKKHLSLVLALAMVIAMFTACGSTENSSSSGAAESETAAISETAAPEATVSDAAPAETDVASEAEEASVVEKVDSSALYPVSEETIHLTGVAPQEPMLVAYQEDLSQEYAQVTAEEKTNVSVDWNISNVDTYTDNITIMLSSGDIPDLVLTPDNYYSIDYLVEQELFLNLMEYLPPMRLISMLCIRVTRPLQRKLPRIPVSSLPCAADSSFPTACWAFARTGWMH